MVKIRAWQISDLHSLVTHANNERVAQNMTNLFPHPYTIESGEAFLNRVIPQQPTALFAIEVAGQAVGGIGIHVQTDIMCKNAELGYWLGEAYWGQGIMTQVVPMAAHYAFTHFDIVRLFARSFGSNIGSQKVLQKCGFVLEMYVAQNLYKNGRFEDEHIYALRRPI